VCMFAMTNRPDGSWLMSGRLDAGAAEQARSTLGAISDTCRLDCSELDYIASVGLGLLAATQKRLLDRGSELILTNLSPHLREVFQLSGFESVFRLE